ncbi:xanthine dehydrogenase accessory factor subfamily [Thermoleophilia bacterium SCSIO 60948]|nr:xanthine dehydrogenase accessory factor subfamily [Thermoleophilia bacterium SCSIO 60948]
MSPGPQAEFARIVAAGGRGAVATVVGPEESELIGRKMLVRDDGRTEGSIESEADLDIAALAAEQMWVERSELHNLGGLEVFIDVTHPAPRLLILGAVDYAAALCKLARACEWRPFICDPRTAFATEARFPEAERIVVAWPDAAFAELGIDRATYIAVLTHDPKLDDAALQIALRSEAAYIGAMGSRRAQEARHERLVEAGMSEVEIGRMAAPIGLDLGATSPEETALSIMAQAVAVRNGRRGGPLSEAEGRIHEIGS